MESTVYVVMDSNNLEFTNNAFDPTLTEALEFGRESLGLLPPDFGRESMGFSNPAYLNEIQQESLGIRSNFELFRDSLLPNENRESLGILHISAYESNLKTPDILLTTINENESVCDLLNKAFLFPNPRKYSLLSSCSNVSFNINSVEEPSKIFSIQSPNDDVFSNSILESSTTDLNQRKSLYSNQTCRSLRIKSLPAVLKSHNVDDLVPSKLVDSLNYNSNSVTSELNKAKFLSSTELSLSCLPFNQGNEGTDIKVTHNEKSENESIGHDLIFIEGKYFANKLANGSILDDSFENELGILDNVPHPHWPDVPVSPNKMGEVSNSKENVKGEGNSKESVREKSDQEIEMKSEHNLDPLSSEKKSEEIRIEAGRVNDLEPKTDLKDSKDIRKEGDHVEDSEHETDFKLPISPVDINTPRSARELLHNLSEILNNTTRSDQQRSEGQHLINSLAELLSDGSNIRSNNLDDSGHSSSINDLSDPEKNTNDFYEILDFSQKSGVGTGSGNYTTDNSSNVLKQSKFRDLNSNRLSLSLNSALPAKLTQPKILNRGNLSKISLNSSKNRTGSSNSSVKSDNMSAGNIFVSQSNLKLKANTEVSRKGPLKAMIPLKDLKKLGKPRTPERTENLAVVMQSKRTSTPISEPKLKPMAASTPTQRPVLKSDSSEMNGRKSLPSNSKGALTNGNGAIKPHIQSPNSNTSTLNTMRRRTLPISTSPLARNHRKQDDSITKIAKSPKNSYHSSKDKSVTPKQSSNSQNIVNVKRRNSISSLKKEQQPGRPRSNSLPKEPVGIMSSMSRIRENLLNSPEFKNLNNKSLLKDNNIILEVGCNRETSAGSKGELITKLKKLGKENVGY